MSRPSTYPDRPSYSAFAPRGPRRHFWSGSLIALGAVGSLAWLGEGTPRREQSPDITPEAAFVLVPKGAENPIVPLAAAPSEVPEAPACAAHGTAAITEAALCLAAEEPATSKAPSCPDEMVEIEGEYCPTLAQFCTRFVDDKPERDRCAEFKPGSRCYGNTVRMHFCIDRYEYPNRAGATPHVAMTWDAAAAQCKADGKRLCKDSEWTLACEGEDRLPYPYGNTRDASACNIDKQYILPDNNAYANPATRDAEIARLDQRELSGSRERCVSQYGVHDMTGNVDEWVVNERGNTDEKPFVSGLKGGYWGPVRNRCRVMTTDHNMWHSGYQIGFRCCSNAS